MRLQRMLARAGVASRRQAEKLILDGVVKVNGTVATIGATVDPDVDAITVKGKRIRVQPTVWIVLNKPRGYAVSRTDYKGRRTVFDLVPDVPGLTYVGRLDIDTGGLVILTTDGVAAHKLTHPKFGVDRMYRVLASGVTAGEVSAALSKKIVVDGKPVRIVRSNVKTGKEGVLDINLVLREGRHHIVRNLCKSLGLKIERLIRLQHGPVSLGRLAPGKWRYLTDQEIEAIASLMTRTGV
ncbi:MAG: rRNA pseudouridine synthase [Gemmatimonadota bacterium]|nr:rRNA pseudouridine synthase [Gemmatimonadota bacterium]MDH5803804.1 rRNA pseudouridine synthase [Gemmatimonadota bacterium]